MTRGPGRPLVVRICGQPFIVSYGDALVDPGGGELTPSGVSDVRGQEIQLFEGQAEHQMRDTMIHEILHAVIGMTGHEGDFRKGGEETVIVGASAALLDVLRSNPHLVAWLTEELP